MVSDSLKLVNDFGVICNSSLVRKVQVTFFQKLHHLIPILIVALHQQRQHVMSNHSAPHDDLPAVNATLSQYSLSAIVACGVSLSNAAHATQSPQCNTPFRVDYLTA